MELELYNVPHLYPANMRRRGLNLTDYRLPPPGIRPRPPAGPPPRRALPLLPASPPPSPVAEQLTFNTAPNPFLFVPMARKAKAGPSTSARKAKPRGGRFIDPVKNLHEQYLRKLQISTMLSRRDPYPPFDERERILKPYNDRVSDAILAVRRERPDYTWEDIDAITKFVVDQFYANQIPPE